MEPLTLARPYARAAFELAQQQRALGDWAARLAFAALFEQLKREAEHVLKVRITSAAPMDATEAARLREALKRRFNRDIELEQSLDPSMLGGAVIDAGEMVIDGSVRGRLARLETALAY